MAIKPTISLKGLRSSASQTGKTTKSIQSSLTSNVKQKKNLYSSIKIIKKRREERGRRNLLQTQLLAPTLVRSVGGPKSLATTTQQGLGIGDRLIGFLKYATAGWIFGNLPTWAAMGNQFVVRLKTAGSILSNYGDETLKVLTGITNVFGAALTNISNFDFLDSSSRLKNSFQDLMINVDDLGKGIINAFNVILQPFTDIPPIGSDQLERERQQQGGGGQPQPPSAPSGGGSVGTKEQKSLLDAIAFAEGTRDQPNNGYKTLFGFGQFNDYSRHPDIVVRKNGYASAAAGRYQFMPATFNRLAKKLGLKDFSPESQDKAALELAKELGITQNILSNEGMSARVSAILGKQWAPFPGSPFGQPTKSLKSIQQAYQRSLGSQQTTASQPQRNLPPNAPQFDPNKRYRRGDVITGSIGRGVSYVEIRDTLGAGRNHQGIDIFCPQGTYIALRLDCEVVFAGWENSSNHNQGYGQLIDVWVPDLGVQLRFGHCAGFLVTSGKVKSGRSFARVGKSGNASDPHIHLEYTRQRGSASGISGDPSPYIPYILLTTQANNPSPQVASQSRPNTPLVPLTSTEVQQQNAAQIDSSYREGLAEGITQERQGRKVVVIDDRSSPIIQQIMAGGGGDGISFSINESALLNNFIRNKLLLDLNYV